MSRDDKRRNLVAYDVPDDRRRTRLANCLLTYGDRIQYSVFVADVSPSSLIRLQDHIREIIDPSEDSVLFCDLGRVSELNESRFNFLGLERDITDNDVLIL